MLKKLVGKILKKRSNKMDFSEKTLEEIEDNFKNLDFQWIKGENLGNIEKFKGVIEEGGNRFVIFENGRRINVGLIHEFMDTFPSSPLRMDANPVPSVSAHPQGKPSISSINYGPSSPSVEESPIYKLLKKQKPNWVNVNISLKLNLPTKSLYNVLVSSFEDADLEIANYVTEGIDIEEIRSAVAESIRSSFYETKKSNSEKNSTTKLEDEHKSSEN